MLLPRVGAGARLALEADVVSHNRHSERVRKSNRHSLNGRRFRKRRFPYLYRKECDRQKTSHRWSTLIHLVKIVKKPIYDEKNRIEISEKALFSMHSVNLNIEIVTVVK
jgi:hypothetical protein